MKVESSDLFFIKSPREVDIPGNYSREDKSKKDATSFTAGTISFLLSMLFLFAAAVAVYVTLYIVPVAGTTSLYMGQRLVRTNLESLRDRALSTGKMKHKREFANIMRLYEYPWNFSLTLMNFGIIAWDLALPIIRYLWQVFKDVIFVVIRKVFGPQTIMGLSNLLSVCAEIAQILINVFLDLMTAWLSTGSNSENFMNYYAPDVGEGAATGGWTVQPNPYKQVNAFVVRLTLLLMRYSLKFVLLMRLSTLPFISLIFNVYFQYHAIIFKALMFMLQLLAPDQPLGQLISAIGNFTCKLSKLLFGNCKTQQIAQKATCQAKAIFAGAMNLVYNVLEDITAGAFKGSTIPSCNVNNLEYTCAPPLCTGEFVTGLGLCDAESCTTEVDNIIDFLRDEGLPCSYWQDPTSVLHCMEVTRDFSELNSTRVAAEPIETIGAELCIVQRQYTLVSCTSHGLPFEYNGGDVGYAVCESDLSESANFQTSCACVLDTPMCDPTCCDLWTQHFNAQMYLQLGSRPLWDLQGSFPQIVFCPLMFDSYYNSTYFSDYTFLHGACNWWERVLHPIYSSFPLTLSLSEVIAPSFITDYQNNTCARTIYQVGVCLPTNETDEPTSNQMLYNRAFQSSEVLDAMNQYVVYGAEPIQTNPTYSTDYALLSFMLVEKSYCQYFNKLYNTSNPLLRNAKWNVNSFTSTYCSQSSAALMRYLDWIVPTTTTMFQEDGLPIATSLAGLDPNIQVFGATIQAPYCDAECQCDTDVETQHSCVNALNTQMNTDGTDVDGFTASTADGLAENRQTYGPALPTIDPNTDPNSPTYGQDKVIYDTVAEAQNFPRQTDPVPDTAIPDETRAVNISFVTPTEDPNDPYYNIPLYFDFQSPLGRSINALDEEEKVEFFGSFEDLKQTEIEFIENNRKWRELYLDTNKNLKSLSATLLEGIRSFFEVRNPYEYSRRQDKIFSRRSAEMGKQRLMKHLEKLQEEAEAADENGIPTDSPDYHPYLRELLGIPKTTNFSMSNEQFVETVLTGLGLPTNITTNSSNWPWKLSISEQQLDAWNQEQALASFKTLYSDMLYKVGPKFYDLASSVLLGEGIPDYLLFDEALFGAQAQSCATSRPLACCDFGKSAYLCCAGIPGCMKDIPKFLFAAYTTPATIDKWVCPQFNSPTKEVWTTTRLFCTAINYAVYNILPEQMQFMMKYTINLIMFPNNSYPENSVGCSYFYSEYLFLLILIFILLLLLLQAQSFVAMLTYMNMQSDNAARDQNIYDNQIKIHRIESVLGLQEDTLGLPYDPKSATYRNDISKNHRE